MAKFRLGPLARPLLIVAALACLMLAIARSCRGAAALPAPDFPVLALAASLFLIHYLLQALGWHGILRALGEPAPLRVSLRMWYMSLIARWLPGRIWYSATRLYLAREADLSVSVVTFAIVFELIYILIGGAFATLCFAGAQMKGLLAEPQARSLFALAVVVVFAAVALVLRPGMLLRLSRLALFRKVVRRLAGGDMAERNPPSLSVWRSLGLVCYYTAFWVYSGVMFGVLASAFLPMNAARWLACIPAFAGSWLIGFFSLVTPAGLGAREGAMWLMLKPVMPQSQALILALASRLMMIGTEAGSVGLACLLLRGGARLPLAAASPSSSPTAAQPVEKPVVEKSVKVCCVGSTFPRSDSDVAVPWLREQLRRLRARGYDVQVFAPAFKGSRSHTVDGITVHRFRYFLAAKEDLTHDSGAPSKIRNPFYLLVTLFYILAGCVALARLHRRERFDILHIHWPFPHGLFGVAAACVAPTRLVMTFYGAELLLAKKFPFVNPTLRFLLRRSRAVTACSTYTAGEVQKLGETNVLVQPLGCPLPTRETSPPRSDRERDAVKTILFVGRLIERKGVAYLISALPLIQRKIPARLIIVGNGKLLPDLQAQAAQMGLQDSVEFRVDLAENELIESYIESDVFVLPAIVDSRGDTEGLGVVLIEALSFRRPVVASNVGGIVDVVKHDRTGLLVQEKSPEALAAALIRILDDPALARRLAEDGHLYVHDIFDWDRLTDRTEALYRDVLGANASEPNPDRPKALDTDNKRTETSVSIPQKKQVQQ